MPESETAIEQDAAARERDEQLDAIWRKIYDYAYRGDGACAFKTFEDAIKEAEKRGYEKGVMEGMGY